MSMHVPKVNIVTVNWNSFAVTLDCLVSLRKLDYLNFEVIVVDNGSIDASADELLRSAPEIRLIRTGVNLGFAGGSNVGIRDALDRGADYVLLLNNDTVVAPDFLKKLVDVAERDPVIGILNPKIYFYDFPNRLNYAGGVYKPWRLFPKLVGRGQPDDGLYNQTCEVSFVSGCAFLIKAEVVRRIGLLDEAYFHFFEDIDWSLRALRAGFKAVYVPAAVIWHKESFVTKKNQGAGFREFYLTRNSILFIRKQVPLRYWPFNLAFLMAWLGWRTIYYLLRLDLVTAISLYKGIWAGCNTKLPVETRQETLATTSKV